MGTLPNPTQQQRPPLPLQSLLFFLLAAAAVLGLCATAGMRRKRCRTHQEAIDKRHGEMLLSVWEALKKALAAPLHRREGSEIVEPVSGELPETARAPPALPLWQRRILMGERCELPSFSGLILYDERGRPLCSSSNHGTILEVKPTQAVTTLKDLL